MITAIADDFTGAAEVGGIGLRYGLDVEIAFSVTRSIEADLRVIATNTRAMSAERATDEIRNILSQLRIDGQHFFKKTDSVLRGHVVAELEVIRQYFSGQKILLVPCNPSLNRIITDGDYYIEGQPIHTTSYAQEYRHNPDSSEILKLLNTDKKSISVLKPGESFAASPFVVGEAQTEQQVEKWARRGFMNGRILAGGADFFSAFLKTRGYSPEEEVWCCRDHPAGLTPALFVSGSGSYTSRYHIKKALQQGRAVCSMPPALFESSQIDSTLIDRWKKNIIHSLETHRRVIVAINKPLINDPEISTKLLASLSRVTVAVMNDIDIRELFIEGGATAAAIIRQLNFKQFFPVCELASGVIRMKVAKHPQLHLTVKPGSYRWPEEIWNLKQED